MKIEVNHYEDANMVEITFAATVEEVRIDIVLQELSSEGHWSKASVKEDSLNKNPSMLYDWGIEWKTRVYGQ